MGFSYPTQFREGACRRMLEGERVESLAKDFDVAAGALYRWKHRALVDAGRKPGKKSYELDGFTTELGGLLRRATHEALLPLGPSPRIGCASERVNSRSLNSSE